jgi:two-component system KDP operon response regulator KdpE
LIIDDEHSVHDVARAYLEREGYEVLSAMGGRDGLALAQAVQPALVVLDLMLPDLSGEQVCAELRQSSDVAIVMLTAKSTEDDRIRGLDRGADDYLGKPFSPRELVARLRAALRRAAPATGEPVITADGLEVDLADRTVRRDGEAIHLTPIEFDLLRTLVRNRGRLLTHRALLQEVWGPGYADDVATLRTNIARLRRKIEPEGPGPRYIRTDPGVGYRFDA